MSHCSPFRPKELTLSSQTTHSLLNQQPASTSTAPNTTTPPPTPLLVSTKCLKAGVSAGTAFPRHAIAPTPLRTVPTKVLICQALTHPQFLDTMGDRCNSRGDAGTHCVPSALISRTNKAHQQCRAAGIRTQSIIEQGQATPAQPGPGSSQPRFRAVQTTAWDPSSALQSSASCSSCCTAPVPAFPQRPPDSHPPQIKQNLTHSRWRSSFCFNLLLAVGSERKEERSGRE